jgi:hypothetical protein
MVSSLRTKRLRQWQTGKAALAGRGNRSVAPEALSPGQRRRKWLQGHSAKRESGQTAIGGSVGPWFASLGLRSSWIPQPAFRGEASYCRSVSSTRGRSVGWTLRTLVFTRLVNSRIVGKPEVGQKRGYRISKLRAGLHRACWICRLRPETLKTPKARSKVRVGYGVPNSPLGGTKPMK